MLLNYFIIINIIAFFAYFIDKSKAKKNKYRISENSLLFLALIGGGAGSIIGMSLFRHKTQKLKFTILVPLLTVINIFILYKFM
ncbi:MAG: DUF1294 domain-containing protein [Tissierellia bacterium]|nr:DUF1294 domain-containing protein [Tissierellia bacterium]